MANYKRAYIALLLLVGIALPVLYIQFDVTLNVVDVAKKSADALPFTNATILPMTEGGTTRFDEESLGEQQQQEQQQEQQPPREEAKLLAAQPVPGAIAKKYSILPRKVYSVIGLESSGTQFVTRMIKDALQLSVYREGSNRYSKKTNEQGMVQVQHFSLPWGSTCQRNPNVPVLDVVLPSQCSTGSFSSNAECSQMTQELWGFSSNHVRYPGRYNLNIVAHKETMDKWGVEQYFIIVLRDQNISRKARKMHCNNPDLLMMEEEVGRNIIIEAINKYILDEEKVTEQNFDFWHANTFNGHRHLSSERKLSSNAIPMGNNVVLVSYESLIMLKDPYIELLYEALGIQSNYMPTIKDGNTKYVGP